MFGRLKTPSFSVFVFALALGCSGPQKETQSSDGLIGRPPPPSEDPFYFVAMERAVPVETSGMVEPDAVSERDVFESRLTELERRERLIQSDFERLGREREQLAESVEALKLDQLATQQERQDLEKLRNRLQNSQEPRSATAKTDTRSAAHTEVQCVACVSICPVIGGQMKCPKEEDLVCGWGSHPEPEAAAKLATAECNGALRLMEGSRVYGEIAGECPRPSCKP